MKVIESNRGLAAIAPLSSVLVPTMGALHAGHAALIRQGAALAQERALSSGCTVTIFVNPTQFNSAADLARYPRTVEADLELCRRSGAATVYIPPVTEVYPKDNPVPVPALPAVATLPALEDAHRPGHFAGVCQVVARLFHLTSPAAAIFGEKDWQQLQVIRAMTRALTPEIEIIPGPTVREPDGLALSSRNRFLVPADRLRALAISRALRDALQAADPPAAEAIMRRTLAQAGITPDYAVVRDAETLAATTWPAGPGLRMIQASMRALIATPVGAVRLIDNAAWTPFAHG
ncbi:MAG: 4-phosphopantoate--beta-alanine ligase [Phycisphaerales bacterium]